MSYYVASRLSHQQMAEIFGDQILRLNEKVTKPLRSAAIKKGISANRKGEKYYLYELDDNQFAELSDGSLQMRIVLEYGCDLNPLYYVSKSKWNETRKSVVSKYPSRVSRDTYRKIESELIDAYHEEIVTMNIEKKSKK